MMSKGMSESLVIVVAAIVILIVALIVLTIFGVGMKTATSIYDAQNQCNAMCTSSCKATGQPPTFYVKFKLPDGTSFDCGNQQPLCKC
jgi:hypothetical protein